MTTTTCSSCGCSLAPSDVLYTADARAVCTSCFERADLTLTTQRAGRRLPATAIALATAPFVLSFTQTTGGVTQDYVAIGGGGAALIVAIVAAVHDRRAGLGPAVAAMVLAAFQLARGFGAFA